MSTTEQMQRDLTVLERRLADGERRIQEAERTGQTVRDWEDFWLDLLRQYEALYDTLHAHAEQQRMEV